MNCVPDPGWETAVHPQTEILAERFLFSVNTSPDEKATRLLKVGGRAFLALLLLWLLLRLGTQDSIWWVAILNSYPFLITVPGWLLLVALVRKRLRRLALGIGGVLLGLFAVQYGALFWPGGWDEGSGRAITVMSYNIKFNNEDAESMIDVIRSANADIVGLQEVTLEHTDLFDAELSEQYPHRVYANPEFSSDVALLSKHPVVELVPFTLSPRRMSLHAIVDVEGQTIDVLVVHLMPNQFDQLGGQSLRIRTRERFNIRRVEVTDVLHEVAQDSANPALLLCDCNLTETSQLYGMLNGALQDVHREVGWGFGRTSRPGWLPFSLQRVDYIWHTGEFGETAVRLGPAAGSDHRPVIATLTLP